MSIKLLETFAGYSSQELALKQLGVNVETVNKVEWYVYAILANYTLCGVKCDPENNKTKEQMIEELVKYNFSLDTKTVASAKSWNSFSKEKLASMYPYLIKWATEFSVDISQVKNIKSEVDIFTYSFPCQDISNNGKKAGFKDNTTRSGLVWEIIRILKNSDIKPKILVMENVSNIVSSRFIEDFNSIIQELNELGYVSTYRVLDATNFGANQGRKRAFMVSVHRDFSTVPFDFNTLETYQTNKTLGEFLDLNADRKEVVESTNVLASGNYKIRKTEYGEQNIDLLYRSYKAENRVLTLNNKITPTILSCVPTHPCLTYDNKVFQFNNKDRLMLMGLSDKQASSLVQNDLLTAGALLKLAGNSIYVGVLKELFKQIIKQYWKD
ncbi:DNA (cytosine-5-)-methyltransferase [Mycoplasma sp. Sp48II]|uniref:DNA (cytosine-5-)-methyltransferase n=1 Tax=Mycoplasma sp. Sp48II TaxID=3401682 RepID=UPI003AABFCC0